MYCFVSRQFKIKNYIQHLCSNNKTLQQYNEYNQRFGQASAIRSQDGADTRKEDDSKVRASDRYECRLCDYFGGARGDYFFQNILTGSSIPFLSGNWSQIYWYLVRRAHVVP